MTGIAGRHPMWLTDGVVGRDEKYLVASSGLGLSDSLSLAGSEWLRDLSDDTSLGDLVGVHKNNAVDPASNNLALSLEDAATYNIELARPASDNLALIDYAHVVLDGYHPLGAVPYDMVSGAALVKGSPVYVISSNVVGSANASPTPTSAVCFPIGFTKDAASGASQDVQVVTEGFIDLDDWTAVAGGVNLTAGARYFLDIVAGMITTSAPILEGQYVTYLGTAITTKTLDIEVSTPVLI